MDPFVGEVRIFCGNYAPEGWFLCQGQTLPISQYQALFAVIGTYYGGNGTTNFCLPNLQGRSPIGSGVAKTGTNYELGETGGNEGLTLTVANLPPHTHAAVATPHNHSVSVPAHTHGFNVPAHTHPFTPLCDASTAMGPSPAGGYPANSGSPAFASSGPDQMAQQTTGQSDGSTTGTTGQASGTSGNSGDTSATVAIQMTGSGLPIGTMSPYQSINYIIAYNGIFPPRPS